MTMNWKRNSKKYIAGILTIALAVGAGQSYGSMEVSAQERTLPGIEKLVQDTVASSDGTFHILEIVPSKENATIGYLAGGEEPVSEGRKLSEMPSATERQTAMDSLDAAKFPTTGPVTFSAYSESPGDCPQKRKSCAKAFRFCRIGPQICPKTPPEDPSEAVIRQIRHRTAQN